ncbi:unnamed protein product [Merluccius merluccius]
MGSCSLMVMLLLLLLMGGQRPVMGRGEDDSISEDVSTSGALSHCHASADGDGGKESELSCVSSEGTSASGLAGLEDGHTRPAKTSEGGAVDMTPACDKIRSLCLSTEEAFVQGKSLPFINPSSLETLRALVQEIQNSGETDPEMWKDCEGRWLHLFQLVEKQYQEQILAQQEQYQCQIQLIQDEIKALVQLQNRQPHTEFSPTSATNPTITTAITSTTNSNANATANASTANATKDLQPTPSAHQPHIRTTCLGMTPSSPSTPLLQRSEELAAAVTPAGHVLERPTTVLSSGYGTLSAWETGPEQTGRGPEEEEEGSGHGGNQQREEREKEEHHWSTDGRTDSQTKEPGPSSCQQRQPGSTRQPLTSWAQRQKLRPRKGKAGRASSQGQELHESPESPTETPRDDLSEHIHPQDQYQPAGASFFPLRRSHSLVSEASGLTYWRLNECDLYHPLPDSLDSGAFLFLQDDTSVETQLSLKEIYQSKQKTAFKCTDWDGSQSSGPLSPQAGGSSDPAALTRQSDRTSGFTSPSHFSSPSYPNQTLPLYSRGPGTPATPDSAADLGNLDRRSSTSSSLQSVTTATPPNKVHGWGSPSRPTPSTSRDKAPPSFFLTGQQRSNRASEEEEGSHTHTSTLKPGSASTGSPLGPRMETASSLEDPVVLSLLRQNLREKHARHVADLKAYYESEIQSLRDRLGLQHLPPDLEKSNRALELRCNHLETALSEANHRVHDLEARNNYLEKKLAEWPERYAVAGAAVKSLQQRLEVSKRSGDEKDALVARLKTRVRQLEESLQNACRETNEKESRREREYKMLQDLLGEYDLLQKDYEGVKDNLLSTENKLVDAQEQISELKSVSRKLESQVKQLEHENQARQRYVSHGNTQPSGAGGGARDLGRRESQSPLTPMMRALMELEETRATQSRAPCKNQLHYPLPARSTLGFVERRHKEPIQVRVSGGLEDLPDASKARTGSIHVPERDGSGAKSRAGAERAAALLKAQRSLSPDGHRSSSLPPRAHRTIPPPTTPTKRETLLLPRSAISSPKRCPTENYSTAFSHMLSRQQHLQDRLDGGQDHRRHSFHSSSPRKRLQFSEPTQQDVVYMSLLIKAPDPGQGSPGISHPTKEASQLGWEEAGHPAPLEVPRGSPPLQDRVDTLAEAERLFDELTQEKLQIEAALSRLPGSGGRVSLQNRLDESIKRVVMASTSYRVGVKADRVPVCSWFTGEGLKVIVDDNVKLSQSVALFRRAPTTYSN